jgi:hypothetical protein
VASDEGRTTGGAILRWHFRASQQDEAFTPNLSPKGSVSHFAAEQLGEIAQDGFVAQKPSATNLREGKR